MTLAFNVFNKITSSFTLIIKIYKINESTLQFFFQMMFIWLAAIGSSWAKVT